MDNLSQRYLNLCQAYVQLADRYNNLDVEQMTLREKLVPFLMAFKYYKRLSEQLTNEKRTLEAEVMELRDRCQQMEGQSGQGADEALLAALAEAEEQIALMEDTFAEQATDSDPSLLPVEKELLAEYVAGSSEFQSLLSEEGTDHIGLLT